MDIASTIETLRSRSPANLLQGLNTWAPSAAAVILVILLAWYLADLVWAMLPGKPQYDWTQRAPAPAMPVASSDNGTGVDYGSIAAVSLFGEADAEPPPAAAVTAPETRLNLKLRGTIAADDETIAHAIIGDGAGKTNVYFVEDAIPGGATLHEVYPDRVILKRGGAFETLRLPKKSTSTNAPVAATPRRSGPPTGTRPGQTPAQAQIAAFTEVIRPQPFMPNGELKGYRVYPGRDRRAFAAMGLRPGDLVTNINGTTLNDIQSGMEVFRSIGEASNITVTIERNGSPMVLTLDSSQFNNASGARR